MFGDVFEVLVGVCVVWGVCGVVEWVLGRGGGGGGGARRGCGGGDFG